MTPISSPKGSICNKFIINIIDEKLIKNTKIIIFKNIFVRVNRVNSRKKKKIHGQMDKQMIYRWFAIV